MNKKKKILLISILCIIAIISIYIFLKGKAYVKASTSEVPKPFTINITEEKMIKEYNNIYNVDYIQQLINQDTESVYETTALAQIRGEEVTFTNYYSGSTDYKTKNVKTSQGKTSTENNIMAAIITGAGLTDVGFKHEDLQYYYSSEAQLAIWEFWNTWIQNSGAKENGFEKGLGNMTVMEKGIDGHKTRKNAQEFATKNTYYANIYFLKYFTHNNLSELNIDNQPNLIYVEILDEQGNIKEAETIEKVEENSDIYLEVTNNNNIVKAGEEIVYNISVYNKNNEEQQNLILSNTLPEGVEFIKVVEIIDDQEAELNENIDYTYNDKNKTLEVNIDKIVGITTENIIDEMTGEAVEISKNGKRNYIVTVKVKELANGLYSQEIKNIIKIKKENTVLACEEVVRVMSDVYLELEVEQLPQKMNKNEECILGLKITNKGLINAENVNVKISIPEEISINFYRIISTSETGEENIIEGTTGSEFENNIIQIPTQKTIYVQLIGSTNKIEESKQITIEGTVNEKKIYWTTNIVGESENTEEIDGGN